MITSTLIRFDRTILLSSLTGKCKTRTPKSNWEKTETGKIDALSAHIHDCSLF
jgi:hypothetical protein